MTPHSDEPARPDELRWTITKGVGQSGVGFYAIDGPDIRRMEVMPAQITDEMVERGAEGLYVHETSTTVPWPRGGNYRWQRLWRSQSRAVLVAALDNKDVRESA